VNLYELTSPDAGDLLATARIGVLTCGATEQHGPHLPMGADTIGVWGLARRLAQRRPLVLAPPIPFGNSDYHLPWPGTLTVRQETLVALVVDLSRSFRHHGLRNVLLLNGHGGNRVAVDTAAGLIQRDLEMRVAVVYFQATAYRAGGGQLDLGHGGRIETGMVLAEHPQWVHLDRALGGDDLEESIRRERQFSARDLYRPQTDWRDVAPSGWFGDAQAASAEEGNALLERMVERVLGYLDDTFGGDA
jgi:creatinine amidohydrolase